MQSFDDNIIVCKNEEIRNKMLLKFLILFVCFIKSCMFSCFWQIKFVSMTKWSLQNPPNISNFFTYNIVAIACLHLLILSNIDYLSIYAKLARVGRRYDKTNVWWWWGRYSDMRTQEDHTNWAKLSKCDIKPEWILFGVSRSDPLPRFAWSYLSIGLQTALLRRPWFEQQHLFAMADFIKIS